MNVAFIIGNLGKEPEVKYLPDGTPVMSFSVATTKRWVKDGEKKEQTTWHRCVKIGKGAEKLAEYLHKGSKIAIMGEIRNREWESDGQKKTISEIAIKELEFLDSKKLESASAGEYNDVPDPDIPF